MSDLSAVYLSADHTFKVAANIGVRLPDNKWITQYDSLFCIRRSEKKIRQTECNSGCNICAQYMCRLGVQSSVSLLTLFFLSVE